MSIGSYIGDESIVDEFKEFRFTDRTIADALSRTDFSINNIDMFMTMCEEGLEFYINKYFQKYLISFANSNIIEGRLHFGISDYGEIIGIPIAFKLITNNYNIIHKMIYNAIDNIKSQIDSRLFKEIKSKIRVEIIPVDTSTINDFGYDLTSYMHERHKEYKLYHDAEQSYKQIYTEMMEQIHYYKRPINDIINDPIIRQELKEYIICHQNCPSTPEINQILDRLNDPAAIFFQIGDIRKEKESNSNIGYWIAKYRDDKTNDILKRKPERSLISKPLNAYYLLMRDFRPLISYFVKKHIQLIRIKITFPGKLSLYNYKMLCYHHNGKPKLLIRTTDKNGQPCSKISDE